MIELLTVPDLPAPIGVSVSLPLSVNSPSSSLKLTTIQQITANELAQQLQACSSSAFTGHLEIEDSQRQWSLYFYLGDLSGCATSVHPIRRWCRQLVQHCPQLNVEREVYIGDTSPTIPITSFSHSKNLPQCWDYDSLAELVKQGLVLHNQMTAVIEGLITEILFDLHQHSQQHTLPLTYKRIPQDSIYTADSVLVLIPVSDAWEQTMQAWEAWQQAGWVDCSQNLAPAIWQTEELRRQTSPQVYHRLTNLADGNRTLRDLAVKLKQNVLPIIQSIKPYLAQRLIGLVEVEDYSWVNRVQTTNLEPTVIPPPINKIQPQPTSPLVAYIDDSQSDSMTMGHILTLVGYRYINVQDPVTALPILLENKPSLIFLDLVMPIANGYEICAQIRRVSAFKNIPIIILTSHDGIVDRVRAKMVGSSGFLAKPITRDKILRILQRYIPTPIEISAQSRDVSWNVKTKIANSLIT
ncbi:response regulator [Iningainema sp. BLCCT55]|uniref:Response regulator n=2 Tax=Iningainema TaxID=1932705 RepID=A0A8J6XPQ8_9CYAN|nr:response regulator [Iningainema tapete BLCC-T55]